jgi:hypothetical protein
MTFRFLELVAHFLCFLGRLKSVCFQRRRCFVHAGFGNDVMLVPKLFIRFRNPILRSLY